MIPSPAEIHLRSLAYYGFDQTVIRWEAARRRWEVSLQRTRETVVGWDEDSVETEPVVVDGVGCYYGSTLEEALVDAIDAAARIGAPR